MTTVLILLSVGGGAALFYAGYLIGYASGAIDALRRKAP